MINIHIKTIKFLFVIFLSSLSALEGVAQSTQSVNLIFDGISSATKNYKLVVDGNGFFSNKKYDINDDQNIAFINSLQAGKHTLKVYRLSNNNPKYNASSKKTLVYSKIFVLRDGYDMDITVNAAGRVQFSENASGGDVEINDKSPMTTDDFNQLLQSIRCKWSQALKGETESEAFNNTDHYFTTSQIRQMLLLINTEGDRLDLAKLSFRSVTDSANYVQLADIFKVQSNKNDFIEFVRAKGWNVPATNNAVHTPMVESKFNLLLQSVNSKWSQALKGETESDAFNNSNNYFSTNQVRQLLTLITGESDRLDLAKLSYRSLTDSANFTQLYSLFKNPSSKDDLSDFLRGKGWTTNGQSTVKTPMADNKFNSLLQTVKSKWSQALKGETESDAFNNSNNYFTTSQVKQLLTLISFENDRLDLAKLSYRSIIDSANFRQLYDLFQTQANKTDLDDFLRSKGWSSTPAQTTVKTPMADADFDQIVNSVRFTLLQFLKVSYETEVFNNPEYFFTTNQIKELLLLINSENNRLELAKLSYKTVTDPANFLQLNSLLNSQNSRNALASYVKAH